MGIRVARQAQMMPTLISMMDQMAVAVLSQERSVELE
jgi:hypothetical protein